MASAASTALSLYFFLQGAINFVEVLQIKNASTSLLSYFLWSPVTHQRFHNPRDLGYLSLTTGNMTMDSGEFKAADNGRFIITKQSMEYLLISVISA